jgi:hypothetical protein
MSACPPQNRTCVERAALTASEVSLTGFAITGVRHDQHRRENLFRLRLLFPGRQYRLHFRVHPVDALPQLVDLLRRQPVRRGRGLGYRFRGFRHGRQYRRAHGPAPKRLGGVEDREPSGAPTSGKVRKFAYFAGCRPLVLKQSAPTASRKSPTGSAITGLTMKHRHRHL